MTSAHIIPGPSTSIGRLPKLHRKLSESTSSPSDNWSHPELKGAIPESKGSATHMSPSLPRSMLPKSGPEGCPNVGIKASAPCPRFATDARLDGSPFAGVLINVRWALNCAVCLSMSAPYRSAKSISSGGDDLRVAVHWSRVCRAACTSVFVEPTLRALRRKTDAEMTLTLIRAGAYGRCVLKFVMVARWSTLLLEEMTSWRKRASFGVMKAERTSSVLLEAPKPEDAARATTAWIETAAVQALRWWNSMSSVSWRHEWMSVELQSVSGPDEVLSPRLLLALIQGARPLLPIGKGEKEVIE